MKIYLVRHGQSLANLDKQVHMELPDHAIPLSDLGKNQAEHAGKFLVEHMRLTARPWPHPVRLWSSPYKRTRDTADLLKKAFNADTPFQLDYREHVNLCEQQFGLFDGIEDDELAKRFPQEYAHYALAEAHEGRFWARMPLGESRFDVAVRVHQAFGTFHRDTQKGIHDIIVVCHGVTLRAFIMQWFHLTPEWFDRQPNPGNCDIWELQSTSAKEPGTFKEIYKGNLAK